MSTGNNLIITLGCKTDTNDRSRVAIAYRSILANSAVAWSALTLKPEKGKLDANSDSHD
jgi:hypothetical protein